MKNSYSDLPVAPRDSVESRDSSQYADPSKYSDDRFRPRDPADLCRESNVRISADKVRIYNDADRVGKMKDWNGYTIVSLEDGLPEFYGERESKDWKDQVGAYACRQMVHELDFRVGVLVRHLDVPWIEAKAQVTVALQIADICSDAFFALDLWRNAQYQAVPLNIKTIFVALLIISQLLWIISAAITSCRRTRVEVRKVEASEKDHNLSWCLKAKWYAGSFFENLFPSPSTLLSARRVVKRMVLGGQTAWVVAYASEAGFKFRYNRGAQSLWPTLVLEDFPLLGLQVYICILVGGLGPVVCISSTLSLISFLHKGTVLWEQHQARELYRKELLDKIACSDEENQEFWKGVFSDEFGYTPHVPSME